MEQFGANASPDALAITAQLLLGELQQTPTSPVANTKVAVILPALFPEKQPVAEAVITSSLNGDIKEEVTAAIIPVKETPEAAESPVKTEAITTPPLQDIPTLVYQKTFKPELNETIAATTESLNDRLKLDKTELGSVLHESPVRDLRKAIGINDRYLFINELFRGDEAAYERSIKTINSFNILPEAEYWIKRELKLKLGWGEDNEAVRIFDHLVRRRFA